MASIDFFQSVSSGLARLIKYESWASGQAMPEAATASRNCWASSGVIGLPRHWLVFLVKIWITWQPVSTPISTALWYPPAID